VAPSNRAVCAVNKVLQSPSSTLQQQQSVMSSLASALRRWSDGLRTINWGPDVTPDIKELTKATAAEISSLIAFANAGSIAAANFERPGLNAASGRASAAAQAVRQDLGIPNVSNPCK